MGRPAPALRQAAAVARAERPPSAGADTGKNLPHRAAAMLVRFYRLIAAWPKILNRASQLAPLRASVYISAGTYSPPIVRRLGDDKIQPQPARISREVR